MDTSGTLKITTASAIVGAMSFAVGFNLAEKISPVLNPTSEVSDESVDESPKWITIEDVDFVQVNHAQHNPDNTVPISDGLLAPKTQGGDVQFLLNDDEPLTMATYYTAAPNPTEPARLVGNLFFMQVDESSTPQEVQAELLAEIAAYNQAVADAEELKKQSLVIIPLIKVERLKFEAEAQAWAEHYASGLEILEARGIELPTEE